MAPSEVDTAERIVRLETKLDFIIERIDRLPPSPACVAKHVELDARLDEMETWRNRAIGAVLVVNMLVIIFMEKIRSFFMGT